MKLRNRLKDVEDGLVEMEVEAMKKYAAQTVS